VLPAPGADLFDRLETGDGARVADPGLLEGQHAQAAADLKVVAVMAHASVHQLVIGSLKRHPHAHQQLFACDPALVDSEENVQLVLETAVLGRRRHARAPGYAVDVRPVVAVAAELLFGRRY
jgi:hypothetical protein